MLKSFALPMCALIACLAACSSGQDEHPQVVEPMASSTPQAPTPSVQCDPGATRSCSVQLPPVDDGGHDCYVGTELCGDAGAWLPCDTPVRILPDGGKS